MKLEELEAICGKNTGHIPDTCQRPVTPTIPIVPTVFNRGLCKIIKYSPNPSSPSGYDEHVEWLDINKIESKELKAKKSPDAHLGGVELDHHVPNSDSRYEYPYCQDPMVQARGYDQFTDEGAFSSEDWAGIN